MINLIIQLGYKCNLNCAYCYQNKYKNNDEMSKDVMDKIIEKVNARDDVYRIHFLGGEPFLYYEKMLYIIDNIKKKNVTYSVATNGMFKKEFYELQEKLGYELDNLLSNKPELGFNKLNNNSSFRFVATVDNCIQLTDTIIDFLVNEYGNKIEILYDASKKWDKLHHDFMVDVKKKFENRLKEEMFKMGLPESNITFECCCDSTVIDTNGNFLYCDRIRTNTVGNIFENEFVAQEKRECIYYRNKNNFYDNHNANFDIQLFGN